MGGAWLIDDSYLKSLVLVGFDWYMYICGSCWTRCLPSATAFFLVAWLLNSATRLRIGHPSKDIFRPHFTTWSLLESKHLGWRDHHCHAFCSPFLVSEQLVWSSWRSNCSFIQGANLSSLALLGTYIQLWRRFQLDCRSNTIGQIICCGRSQHVTWPHHHWDWTFPIMLYMHFAISTVSNMWLSDEDSHAWPYKSL